MGAMAATEENRVDLGLRLGEALRPDKIAVRIGAPQRLPLTISPAMAARKR
jgi:hypothetical protein